jgi:hypothetical protein
MRPLDAAVAAAAARNRGNSSSSEVISSSITHTTSVVSSNYAPDLKRSKSRAAHSVAVSASSSAVSPPSCMGRQSDTGAAGLPYCMAEKAVPETAASMDQCDRGSTINELKERHEDSMALQPAAATVLAAPSAEMPAKGTTSNVRSAPDALGACPSVVTDAGETVRSRSHTRRNEHASRLARDTQRRVDSVLGWKPDRCTDTVRHKSGTSCTNRSCNCYLNQSDATVVLRHVHLHHIQHMHRRR